MSLTRHAIGCCSAIYPSCLEDTSIAGLPNYNVAAAVVQAGVIRGLDDSMLDWQAHVDMAQRVLAKTQTPAQ
jgi:hypothetical protein